jgi:tetratricopeptide (TPR) repeat protein
VEIAVFGETSDIVCRTRSLIATALLRQGRAAEAEPYLVRSYEKLYGIGAPVSGQYDRTLVELAGLRLAQNRIDDAEALFRKSLETYAGFGVPDHPDTADALLGLARVARTRNRPDEALALVNRALANLRAELPEDHWRVALARSSLDDLTALTARRH